MAVERMARLFKGWQFRFAFLSFLLAVTALGCTESGTTGSSTATSTVASSTSDSSNQDTGSGIDMRVEFDTGLVTSLVVPEQEGDVVVPLVVLVPGGGWATADPAGLMPLAQHLAALGAAVSLTTHRAGDDGVYFPDQPSDVACAIGASASAARDAGFQVGEVTVVGHSSGAHLASLVALLPDTFSVGCRHDLVAPDRLVGLAGPYDVTRAARFAGDLFGPDNTDSDDWAAANPVAHAHEREELSVLLIHGQADATVPMVFTEEFAAALEDAGHPLTVLRPAEVDHHSIYSPEIGGALIAEWLNL